MATIATFNKRKDRRRAAKVLRDLADRIWFGDAITVDIGRDYRHGSRIVTTTVTVTHPLPLIDEEQP